MRHIYLTFIFLIFFYCAINPIAAQQLSINKLSENVDELDFVYDMMTNDHGELLLATDHSLYNFNGFSFNKIDLEHASSAPFVTTIEQGESSQLIGHYKGLISHINSTSAVSINIKAKIVGIVASGNLHYVFSQDGKCLVLDENYELFQTVALQDHLTVYEVIFVNNKLYIGTSNGLFIYSISEFDGLKLLKSVFTEKKIESIAVSANRLLAVVDNQVISVSRSDWSLNAVKLSAVQGKIKSIVCSDYRLVVGTNIGVYDYFLKENEAYISGFKAEYSSNAFPITKLYLSQDGTIYVGTYGLGLWAIPSPTYYFIPNEQINNRKVSAIGLFEEHTFVIGGQLGLSFYFNGDLINESFPSSYLLNNKRINVIRPHPEGLVMGTESDGIWLLDSTKQLRQLVSSILSIEDIASDEHGNLWISTSFEGLYTLVNGVVRHFSKQSTFSRNDLSKLNLHGDKLWFINGDDGLGYVNLIDSQLVIPSNLPPVKVIDFAVDKNGYVWAATQGDGIMYYTNDNYSFIDLSEVMGNNFTNTLVMDKAHNIWVSSQNTLLKWNNKNKVRATNVGLYFETTFRERANFYLENGNWIYYGTEEGLVYFNVNQYFTAFPSDFIYSINDGQSRGQGDSIPLSYTDKFEISFHFNDLVRNPFLNFFYRVNEDLDKWVPIDGNSFVLNSLGYGRVKVEIKAISKSGVVYGVNHFYLDINKPFWLQLWFYVLVFIGIGIGIYFYIQLKTKQLRNRNIELKKLVALRTKEITQKNKKLEQFAYAVSHDLKNPVINIIGLVEILEQMNVIKEDHPKQVFEMLGTSSRQLDRLVKGLVELLKVKREEQNSTENSIDEIFKQVKQAISLQITKSNAEITEDFSQVSFIRFNHSYLYSIVYNLTSNAVKYRDPSRPLKITVSTFNENEYVVFQIQDNGLGMDLNHSDGQLFKMFHRFHDHVEGTGVGLHMINEMVESSGGFINVESKVGEGSLFKIYLKV